MDFCSENVFLSIIIPVYNAEKYVGQCIESLINQDLFSENYEIICVDDGSIDGSLSILYEYAKICTNLRIYEQKNGGVSKARNTGMNLARGKYLWFIDADDFIFPNILKKLESLANNGYPDRIKIDSYTFVNNLEFEDILLMDEAGKLKSNAPYKEVMATRTLYKRKYLIGNSICFLEGVHYGEDGVFNYQTLIYDPVTIDSGILAYFYRKHDSAVTSLPKEMRVKKSLLGTKKVFDLLVDDYNKKICISQTKRMLLYWMYAYLEYYKILGKEYFLENFSWKYTLINVPIYDCNLRKLIRLLKVLSKKRDYDKLVKFVDKYTQKNKKLTQEKLRKKKILGYLKHPKRFIKLILRCK